MQEYRSVLALARVLTGDLSRAEDVTHDAFVAAFESWQKVSNPQGWIRRVVANKSSSALRKKYAEDRALHRLEPEPSTSIGISEDAEEFWALVRSLPPRQAQAVALFYLEDRSIRDIAGILRCKESTARGFLAKGRRSLSRALKVSE